MLLRIPKGRKEAYKSGILTPCGEVVKVQYALHIRAVSRARKASIRLWLSQNLVTRVPHHRLSKVLHGGPCNKACRYSQYPNLHELAFWLLLAMNSLLMPKACKNKVTLANARNTRTQQSHASLKRLERLNLLENTSSNAITMVVASVQKEKESLLFQTLNMIQIPADHYPQHDEQHLNL
jgi:hypothetical protein